MQPGDAESGGVAPPRTAHDLGVSPDNAESERFKTRSEFCPTLDRQKSSVIARAGMLLEPFRQLASYRGTDVRIDSSHAIRSSTIVQSSGIPFKNPRSSDTFNRAITEAQRSQCADSKYSMTSSWLHVARE